MFNKKTRLVISSVLGFALLAGGCSSGSAPTSTSPTSATPASSNNGDQGLDQFFAKSESELGKVHSIYVDKEKKQVKVYATVNGKYLVEPTRHGLNWVGGKYGDQAVFRAYANPLAFNQSLKEIGGTPAVDAGGDASKEFAETPDGKVIKGDQVKVSITWQNAGKEYEINDVMVDSTGKKLDYHFGGNHDAAQKMMTGCFMCFDSCPVGITSNAAQPVDTFKNGKAQFHGNAKVLPQDGTPVVLTYSIVK